MAEPQATAPLAHGERAHPGPAKYVQIAVILAIVTALEVATFYIHVLGPLLIPVLLVLSAFKFALVVMFYMHLRFDSPLFSGFFVSGLTVAGLLVVAFILLFIGHQT